MELVFCYNAKSGFKNGLIDLFHKTISPKTYPCNLCAITYTYKKREKWKNFIDNFHLPISFMYIDHLRDRNLENYFNDLPCCFININGNYKIVINKKEINSLKNEDELIKFLENINYENY